MSRTHLLTEIFDRDAGQGKLAPAPAGLDEFLGLGIQRSIYDLPLTVGVARLVAQE